MDYKAKNVVAEKVVQAVPPGEKQPGDQGICAAVRDFDIGRTEGALRRAPSGWPDRRTVLGDHRQNGRSTVRPQPNYSRTDRGMCDVVGGGAGGYLHHDEA